jgi:hypothetical protein
MDLVTKRNNENNNERIIMDTDSIPRVGGGINLDRDNQKKIVLYVTEVDYYPFSNSLPEVTSYEDEKQLIYKNVIRNTMRF